MIRKKIIILGADGYLGWPACMYFSSLGYDVLGIDNFVKKKLEKQEGVSPLWKISSINSRINTWKSIGNKSIKFEKINILNFTNICKVIKSFKPEVIIHLGEQPSAPFSMKNIANASYTQTNNNIGTLNLLFAIKEIDPDIHFIKLGTMGEYGTPNIEIPDGYINISYKNRKDNFLFPKNPFSFYHLSKVHGSYNISFACKNWGLTSTELNQGVVYGIDTPQTSLDKRLKTSFHYDHIFGTVINRFSVMSMTDNPILIYGKGNQTRTFININDTMQCLLIAVKNRPKKNKLYIFNQFTEKYSIKELAKIITHKAGEYNKKTNIKYISNPRVEKDKHFYRPQNQNFIKKGLSYKPLSKVIKNDILIKLFNETDKINKKLLNPNIRW